MSTIQMCKNLKHDLNLIQVDIQQHSYKTKEVNYSVSPVIAAVSLEKQQLDHRTDCRTQVQASRLQHHSVQSLHAKHKAIILNNYVNNSSENAIQTITSAAVSIANAKNMFMHKCSFYTYSVYTTC